MHLRIEKNQWFWLSVLVFGFSFFGVPVLFLVLFCMDSQHCDNFFSAFIMMMMTNALFFHTSFEDPLLSVSLSYLLAPIPNTPWFSFENFALYITYLLTYVYLLVANIPICCNRCERLSKEVHQSCWQWSETWRHRSQWGLGWYLVQRQ